MKKRVVTQNNDSTFTDLGELAMQSYYSDVAIAKTNNSMIDVRNS